MIEVLQVVGIAETRTVLGFQIFLRMMMALWEMMGKRGVENFEQVWIEKLEEVLLEHLALVLMTAGV